MRQWESPEGLHDDRPPGKEHGDDAFDSLPSRRVDIPGTRRVHTYQSADVYARVDTAARNAMQSSAGQG